MESRLEMRTAHEERAEGIRKEVNGAIRKVNATDFPTTGIGSPTGILSTFRILDVLKRYLQSDDVLKHVIPSIFAFIYLHWTTMNSVFGIRANSSRSLVKN